MRVVLDTNVVLQMLPRKSRYHPILQAFLNGSFEWIVTTDVFLEYIEILQQRASPQAVPLFEQMLFQAPEVADTQVYFFFNAIEPDPDDDKFVDAYPAGNGDFLVTWDKHFELLRDARFPKVQLINPDEFLTILNQHST